MNPLHTKAQAMKDELAQLLQELTPCASPSEQTEALLGALRACGYSPTTTANGNILCETGDTGKTILLQAGRDPALLLGAAKLLRESPCPASGKIKLHFLTGTGALEKIDADASVSIQPCLDESAGAGTVRYALCCAAPASSEFFIHIQAPQGLRGVHPLTIAVRINLALHELLADEFPPAAMVRIHCGHLTAGLAANSVPESADLNGVVSTSRTATIAEVKQRVEEIAAATAEAFRASVHVEWKNETPAAQNDPALAVELAGYLHEVAGAGRVEPVICGSADANMVDATGPSVLFELAGGGDPVNDLIYGAALYGNCALRYLGQNDITQGGAIDEQLSRAGA